MNVSLNPPASPFQITITAAELQHRLRARVGELETLKTDRANALTAALNAQRAALNAAQAHGHASVMGGIGEPILGGHFGVRTSGVDRQIASLQLVHDLISKSSAESYTMTLADLAQLDLIDVAARFDVG